MDAKWSRGESVKVATRTINGGDTFEGSVVSIDTQTETVCIDCRNASTSCETAIVGFSEVDGRTDTIK
jgi:ribosome maturation factor RimP